MKSCFISVLASLLTVALLCGCNASSESISEEILNTQVDMSAAAALIADIPTTQYFTDEAVAKEDIDTILLAGVNAPSAMNGQPWHFSAITDPAVIEEISGGMSFSGPPAGMVGMPGGEMPENMSAPPEDFTAPEGFAAPEDIPAPEGFAAPGAEGRAPVGEAMPAPPVGGGATKAGIEDAALVIVVSCKDGSEFDAGLACQNMSVEAQLLGYGSKIVSAPTMAINAEGQEELRAALGIPEGYTACGLLLVGMEDITVDTTADTYTGATARNPLVDMVTYLEG